MLRPRCLSCKSKIGFHWVFAGFFCCLEAVILGFLGLYLLGNFSIVVSSLIWLLTLALLSIVAGVAGPLETKQKWWEP